MKFEYCEKCDRGIKTEEEAYYTKNKQLLCQKCYFRANRKHFDGLEFNKQARKNIIFISLISIVIILLATWGHRGYQSFKITNQRKQAIIKHKKNIVKELQKAKKEYDKAVAKVTDVRLWAEVEIMKSNAELQNHVNSMFTPEGELLPDWIASPVINTTTEINAQKVREINAKVKFYEDEVRKATNKLAAAKRKAREAGIKTDIIENKK